MCLEWHVFAFYLNKVSLELMWWETLPELVESLLVRLKHVSQVDVEGLGCVPVLQLTEVGIVCESHDVQNGLAVLCVTYEPRWVRRTDCFLKDIQARSTTAPPTRHTISMSHPLRVAVQGEGSLWWFFSKHKLWRYPFVHCLLFYLIKKKTH